MKKILAQAKTPLRDASAVNTTRLELYRQLQSLGLPLETGSGGLTKHNRSRLGLPKSHWADAACVGASTPQNLDVAGVTPLLIKACGYGKRQFCATDEYGFPIQHKTRKEKYVHGYCTGDIVKADIPKGKYKGHHTGRLSSVLSTGQFIINRQIRVNHKYCKVIHHIDGYSYSVA